MTCDTNDPLLSQEDVAVILGVTVKRLRNWRENGTGGPPWFKVGQNAARYRREDLDAWLQARRRVPTMGRES